ncbi:unnamed protein product [Heligmosomoides polygyrus]|uniref:IMD domain-containing protein n=1 Tax=Heligmosomoides polygyrus TaxID=6339 RepID=A0A183GCC1_HELPZ|nr:unnamed protein product [Heligmosomoides polygyrus]
MDTTTRAALCDRYGSISLGVAQEVEQQASVFRRRLVETVRRSVTDVAQRAFEFKRHASDVAQQAFGIRKCVTDVVQQALGFRKHVSDVADWVFGFRRGVTYVAHGVSGFRTHLMGDH